MEDLVKAEKRRFNARRRAREKYLPQSTKELIAKTKQLVKDGKQATLRRN